MTWNFQEMNVGYINEERAYRVQNSHYYISTDCNTFAAEYNSLVSRSSAREATTHKMKMVHYANGGHAVALLIEALRYKPESRGFDSRWCHWIFLLT